MIEGRAKRMDERGEGGVSEEQTKGDGMEHFRRESGRFITVYYVSSLHSSVLNVKSCMQVHRD